MKQNMVAGLA